MDLDFQISFVKQILTQWFLTGLILKLLEIQTRDLLLQNIADSCKLLLSYFIFQDDAIEAGVRVLGCACDTDFTYTVSLDEANAEQCVGVQQWMTIGHDGQDFLGIQNRYQK